MNEEYGEESRTSVETSLEREKREKPVRENTFEKKKSRLLGRDRFKWKNE